MRKLTVILIWVHFQVSFSVKPNYNWGLIQTQLSQEEHKNYISNAFKGKILASDILHYKKYNLEHLKRFLQFERNLENAGMGGRKHETNIMIHPSTEYLLHENKKALLVSLMSISLLNKQCISTSLLSSTCSKAMLSYSLQDPEVNFMCSDHKCRQRVFSKYRPFDGSCSHIGNISLGKSNTVYRRLLPADYLDGIQQPRLSIQKNDLPSARWISSNIISKFNSTNKNANVMTLIWNRLLQYDLTGTVVRKTFSSGNDIQCCSLNGMALAPRYSHTFCAPISITNTDPRFSNFVRCLPYVRSMIGLRPQCNLGYIEQINEVTHFLDGSFIYGSTNQDVSIILNVMTGTLKYLKDTFKYQNTGWVSGDSTNQQLNLLPIYAVWISEHFRIANSLKSLNKEWDDVTVFQETRRIVIAELQHITYNEWLSTVLGENVHNIISKWNSYTTLALDPSISNSFATAVIQILNLFLDEKKTWLKNTTNFESENFIYNLANNADESNTYQSNEMKNYILGLITEEIPSVLLDDSSINIFFKHTFGYDKLTLHIQRGRDHGLPSYNAYRGLCGLKQVESFDDLKEFMPSNMVEILSKMYENVLDIDLIIGGLLENKEGNTLFGPTISCILKDQLFRTALGDKYFYKFRSHANSLTLDQISSIEGVTLARIFCDNVPNMVKIPRNVFQVDSESNPPIMCKDTTLPRLNLSLWKTNV